MSYSETCQIANPPNATRLPVAGPVFDCIEAYAPGFRGSVVGRDVLTPPDLERIFGLPGGVRLSLGVPHHIPLCTPTPGVRSTPSLLPKRGQ